MKTLLLLSSLLSLGSLSADTLAEQFRNPPHEAKPQVWWHWMNGNVSKPGITADLEAMAKVGIGGVQIFDAGLAIPAGPVAFATDAWFDHVAFAIREAGRLGLEVVLANCSGWSSTGGPWVTPEDAMKIVAYSRKTVKGPAKVDLELATPGQKRTVEGFCRDIAVVAFPTPKPGARIDDFDARVFRGRKNAIDGRITAEPSQCVPGMAVVDLTSSFKDGRLAWDVPAGDWTVLRFAYRAQNVVPRSASRAGLGLECDKLSAGALDRSFDAYVGKVLARVGRGSAFTGVLIDSYEVGCQNWTAGFEREFRARKGYDIVRYLPTLAGYVIDSPAETERFYGDFRRVIADLFAENYGGRMAARCHENGLKFHCEPYGNGPFDDLQYGRRADVPMCEFWSFDDRRMPYHWVTPLDFRPQTYRPWGCKMIGNPKTAAAIAHVWGKPVAASESFTAYAPDSRWTKGPFELKVENDRIFCGGVNRIVYHRSAHQPWAEPTRYPGMTMAHYGTQFERTQTWWEHGAKEWLAYQTRCQALLQSGRFVADALFFAGEGAPNNAQAGASRRYDAIREAVPFGYDYDVCDAEAFLMLTAEDGCVVVPGGVKYRVLALPKGSLSAPFARRAESLRKAGVRIVPAEDVAAALAEVAPAPDFAAADLSRGTTYVHRRTAESDLYFVAQPNYRPITDRFTFRSRRSEVELWDAVTGEIRIAEGVERKGDVTSLTLDLPACGSVFVVFRDKPTAGRLAAAGRPTVELAEVKGPWAVTFREPGAAADVAAATFAELADWTADANPDVRYFSGTATYRKSVPLDAARANGGRVVLDLGDVKNIAEVTVNGKAYPALWQPPFQVDVTEAVRGATRLDLTVKVTNYWPNRLIGDDVLFAPDAEYNDDKGYPPLTAKAWPGWLTAGGASPTGRHAFTACRLWTKADRLLPSGLLGPVKVFGIIRTE